MSPGPGPGPNRPGRLLLLFPPMAPLDQDPRPPFGTRCLNRPRAPWLRSQKLERGFGSPCSPSPGAGGMGLPSGAGGAGGRSERFGSHCCLRFGGNGPWRCGPGL